MKNRIKIENENCHTQSQYNFAGFHSPNNNKSFISDFWLKILMSHESYIRIKQNSFASQVRESQVKVIFTVLNTPHCFMFVKDWGGGLNELGRDFFFLNLKDWYFAADKAHTAIFWPIPGIKKGNFHSSGFTAQETLVLASKASQPWEWVSWWVSQRVGEWLCEQKWDS